MTSSMHKALQRMWDKCPPLPLAASMMVQHFGLWKPTERGNIEDLLNMPGVQQDG